MKEATSGGKKRGIDEVNESIVAASDDTIKENDNEVILKEETQETITDSEVCFW